MVRERACTSIAELLIDNDQPSETIEYLKHWAKSQQLESLAVFALLVLLRAKMLCQTFELPALIEIIEMIGKPSLLSYLLLKEICCDEISRPDWGSMCLQNEPRDCVPSAFFQKYCTNYIPPIYETHAHRIEQKYGILFYKHWFFEWKTILANINRKPSSEPLHFWGRPEYEHYDGIDLLLSEVYRSAYLRTLAWAINKNGFREEDATYLAITTCPIDPSLWKVQSPYKPKWWPTASSSSEVIDTVLGEIWRAVGSLWKKSVKSKEEWVVTQANGRVCQTNDSVYDLEIRGVFQRCCGSSKPDLEKIFEKTSHNVPYITTSVGLEGYVNQEPISKYTELLEDWELLPIACQVWPYTTPRWQSRRLRRGIWIPAPFLAKKVFKMICLPESLNILDDKKIVGKWQDWNWNLQEKNRANLTPSTGEYLLVNRSIIDEFADNQKCCFCWLCQITQYYRKYEHEKYIKYSHVQEYGASNIIMR